MQPSTHPDPFAQAAGHAAQRSAQLASIVMTAGQVFAWHRTRPGAQEQAAGDEQAPRAPGAPPRRSPSSTGPQRRRCAIVRTGCASCTLMRCGAVPPRTAAQIAAENFPTPRPRRWPSLARSTAPAAAQD
jgi:hypothetical protein